MDSRKPSWQPGVEYASLSDVGLERTNNEDSCATVVSSSEANWRAKGHLFIVADGMGAHNAGELASKLAVDTIPHLYHKIADQPPGQAIVRAILGANDEIYNRGVANFDFQGMGTTTSALVLAPQGAYAAQVGDSRVYRLRGTRLEQLTFDHSLQWELRASGSAAGREVAENVRRNIITRSLGPRAEVDVDLEGPFNLAPGDTFLLCSDGLSNQFENKDSEMGMVMAVLPPKEAVRALVDLANLRGGPDNITVTVARVVGPDICNAPAEDQRPGEKSSRGRVAAWIGMALLGGAIVTAFALQYWPLAAVCGLAMAVGAALLLSTRPKPRVQPAGTMRPRQTRQGPYVVFDATPTRAFAEHLANEFRQLREAAESNNFSMDWDRVITLSAAAEKALVESRYGEAIADYCRAISFVFTACRGQDSRKRPTPGEGERPALN